MTKRKVPVNDKGYRIGEGHHNSTIPDAVVVTMRDLKEYEHLTCREIARRTGCQFETVRAIVYYRRRADVPRDWKEIEDGE